MRGCIGYLVMDYKKFTTPALYIGFYIAAGSAVCFLFMLFDVISAFRQTKRWVPCRLFSLNSLTLTLLAICAKLPVDLTTPMPIIREQLCKLTSTALICIAMGFFHPSIGDNRGADSYTNMAALTIFVITVIVNICIQMSTGVIYALRTEQVIIMLCMLVLLMMLWSSALDINHLKEVSLYSNRDLLTKGEGSMLGRLKLCYLHGFSSNPQLRLCREASNFGVGGFCFISCAVVAEAAFRSMFLDPLCGALDLESWRNGPEHSEYKWSIQLIFGIQSLTVFFGCLVTSFRWFTMASQRLGSRDTHFWKEKGFTLIRRNSPVMAARTRDICAFYFAKLIHQPLLLFSWTFMLIPLMVSWATDLCFSRSYNDEEVVQEYKHLIGQGTMKLNGWMVWKAATEMNQWMMLSKKHPPENLFKLLSRTTPSQQLRNMDHTNSLYTDQDGFQVSSLSMALLVGIASFSLRNRGLEEAFREAHEIIDFIQTRIYSMDLQSKNKSKFTKALLLGEGFGGFLPKIIERSPYATKVQFDSQTALQRALVIIRELESAMDPSNISQEVGAITKVISAKEFDTVEGLYSHLQQMFVDMLHFFLAQFPDAVYKEFTESPAEEFEKRVRFALKLLCKIESLDAQVQWSFPRASKMRRLITTQVIYAQSQNDKQEEHVDARHLISTQSQNDTDYLDPNNSVLLTDDVGGGDLSSTQDEVIIEVGQ